MLLGGETAEMPGFYAEGEYDVAGFIVGVADREMVIDGSRVVAGDVLLALPSAGLHTNGYSLARKLFFDEAGYNVDTHLDALGMTVGEALLKPHLSYLRPLEGLLDTGVIKALAHITGGGLLENIPRVLPEGTAVRIERDSWPVPPVFKVMQEIGNVLEAEMFRTFNMGVGMVIICSETDAPHVLSHLASLGETPHRIGAVVEGARAVSLA